MMNTNSVFVGSKVMGNSWFSAILAVLELVLGFAMLSFPMLLGTAAVWVAGFVLLVLGVVHLFHVFTRAGQRLWSLFSGVLYLVVGSAMVLLPFSSMALLTLVIGIALLAGGILRLITAVNLRAQPGTPWRVFNAIVSLVLGAMVVWSWPNSSLWLIGTIIAVEMIFSGWALLFLSLTPQPKQA
ncbi:MAG: hypothetical protein E7033_01030 [Akkermansiaceae bacterium]|nr:hypothetical protein [Akkermansiaceae bacterium]